MCSTCARVAEEVSIAWLKDEQKRELLLGIHVKMVEGFYNPSYLGLVIDPHFRRTYNLADAVVWANFLSLYFSGRVLAAEVGVPNDATPFSDKDTEGNNQVLASLFEPFTAQFFGGKSTDGDGSFAWNEPISLTRTLDDTMGNVTTESVSVGPRSVALEVGSVNTYNTLHRLRFGSGVARWPYDSSTITILIPDAHRDGKCSSISAIADD
jgi:hypothetical protein